MPAHLQAAARCLNRAESILDEGLEEGLLLDLVQLHGELHRVMHTIEADRKVRYAPRSTGAR